MELIALSDEIIEKQKLRSRLVSSPQVSTTDYFYFYASNWERPLFNFMDSSQI